MLPWVFLAHITSMILWIVRMYEVVERFYRKPFLVFSTICSISIRIGLRSIIKLICNACTNFASAILSDSKFTFHGEGENAAFCLFHCCLLFTYRVASSKGNVKISCLPNLWEYFVETCMFSASFYNTASSCYTVNCSVLLSNWLLKFFE